MSVLETFGGRRTPPKIDVPEFVNKPPAFIKNDSYQEIEDEIANIGKQVLAARERGDRALADAKQQNHALPPTASNVLGGNALELLKSREQMLNEAIMLAERIEMIAGEMISCGAQIQEFMKKTQNITSAIIEGKPALALVPEQAVEPTPAVEAPLQDDANDVRP